jgi:hypothetical protein
MDQRRVVKSRKRTQEALTKRHATDGVDQRVLDVDDFDADDEFIEGLRSNSMNSDEELQQLLGMIENMTHKVGLDNLNTRELQENLHKRGKSPTGNKAERAERLVAAISC